MPNVTHSMGKLTVLKINDWTSGIVSQTYSPNPMSVNSPIPGGAPFFFSRVPNAGQKITSSPYTYGVLGLPGGGLLLGPTVFSSSTRAITLPTGMASGIVSGVATTQDLLVGGDNTTWFVVNGVNGSNEIQTALYNYFGTAAPTQISTTTDSTPGATTSLTPSFPFATTLSNGSRYEQTIVWSTPPHSTPTDALGLAYYQVAGGGIFSNSAQRNGYGIPANGRVWFNEQGTVAALDGNDDIYNGVSYTDPTLNPGVANLTINTARTLLDYDDVASFGAWGCVSSGATLIVKSTSGALIVSSDIFNPTVTRAPAVVGTNGLQCQAALTPLGLVYRSQSNGVWAWSGGASATKISTQFSDSSFNPNANNNSDLSNVVSTYYSGSGYFANVQYFNNMIFFDSGYFYDLDTQSWWSLPPYLSATQAVGKMYSNNFYAPRLSSPNAILPDFDTFYLDIATSKLMVTSYAFDVSWDMYTSPYAFTPPTGYFGSFWESNPIQLAMDDIVEVQEINIVMQGTGTLNVACLGIAGNILSNIPTLSVSNNAGFSRIRINTKFSTDVLILQVSWNNAVSPGFAPYPLTPIIESIEVKYQARFPVTVTG